MIKILLRYLLYILFYELLSSNQKKKYKYLNFRLFIRDGAVISKIHKPNRSNVEPV